MPTRVLRPKQTKTIAVVVGCLLALAAGADEVMHGKAIMGWLVAGFGGLGAVAVAMRALPNCSYLELGPEGFTICELFRRKTYSWSDVEGFEVMVFTMRYSRSRQVVFNFAPGFEPSPTLRKIGALVSGFESSVPDTYGMAAADLASLMNSYRNEFLAAKASR